MLICEYESVIQGSNQCRKTIGGIRKSWAVDWQNVESVQGLAETGTIMGLTLKEGKTLKVLEYDNDNTASYNQTTNRVGLDARVEQVSTLKFTGANVEKSVIANKAKGVHNGLWFHLQNDGTIHSQGAEFGANGDKVIKSLVGAKVNPNINSNTGEGSSDVTWNIISTSTDVLPVTMTIEDLDALVGEDTGDSDIGDSDIGDSDIGGSDIGGSELPTVMLLPLDETTLSIVWDDGGDPLATRSLIIDNGINSITLDSSLSSIDLGDILYGIESEGSSSQTYTISAEITNSVGTDTDSGTCPVSTETWASGRFIYAINSIEAAPPTIDSVTYDGINVNISKTDGIWKYYNVEVRYHRNPNFITPDGQYAEGDGNAVDDGSFIFGIANLSTKFCDRIHLYSNIFVSVRVNTPINGYHAATNGLPIPHTLSAGFNITSVNGVSC